MLLGSYYFGVYDLLILNEINHKFISQQKYYDIIIFLSMQNQSQILTKVNIPKININFFKFKKKAIVASGPCQITDNQSTVLLKIDQSKTQVNKKEKLLKLKQINYTTYFYSHPNGSIYTFSLINQDYQSVFKFQQVMSQWVEVTEFFTEPNQSEVKQKVILETPIDQPNPGQFGSNNDDKLQAIGKGVGSVLGGISSIFNTEKINKESDQLVTKISRDTFSQSTLSEWQKFKNKCAQINASLTNAIKPISQKCSSIVTDIGKNFQASDNGFIKGVRQYSKKTQKALNQGYGKADAPRRASFMPQNQNPPPNDSQIQSKKDFQGLKVQYPVNLRQQVPLQSTERQVTFDVPKKSEDSYSNERKSLL